MSLADVPLRRRCGAVLNVLASNPSLSVEERGELLAVATWPPDVATPAGVEPPERSSSTPEEREYAVWLRRQGTPLAEIAARYGCAVSTVKMWCAAANRGG